MQKITVICSLHDPRSFSLTFQNNIFPLHFLDNTYSLTFSWRNPDKRSAGILFRRPIKCRYAIPVHTVPLQALTIWVQQHTSNIQLNSQEPFSFLRAKAAMLSARLSYRNSVRLSVTWVDQAKTVQARISKFSPSAAWKTLVSGTVKLFRKLEGGHPEWGR